MAKIGMEKKTLLDKAAGEQVDHTHVPGKAYNVEDPTTRLVHIVGGGFFNEPKYYDESRSYEAFASELKEKGCISSKVVDSLGLTSQANEVISTAVEVANSSNPEDLLIVARWARDPVKGLKLRTTPQILLSIAAAHKSTKPFVRAYTPHIVKRADELRQVFAAYRHLFQKSGSMHKGALPHSLRKGLADAFRKFGEYDFLKYDSDIDDVSFKDVLLMVGGSKKVSNPVSKELFEFLVNGKVINPAATPMIAAKAKFNSITQFSDVSSDLMKAAGVTWENVISKFGSTKETWESVIPQMGEMALVRNLRNFEDAEISKTSWDKVYKGITDDASKTKLLPFRYYAALKNVTGTDAKSALGVALDASCANLPELQGVTFAITDNSGSAQGCAISDKSSMRVADAGNMLMAVIAKRMGRNAMIGVFGDSYKEISFSTADSCLNIHEKVDFYATKADRRKEGYLAIPEFQSGTGVGGGTETGLWWALKDITDRKIHVDRIVLLSDLCCYTQGDVNCGHRMDKYFGKNATVQGLIDRYRATVNKNVFVYSVNLNGHSQAQTRPGDKRTALLSGWSEQIISVMRDFELQKAAAVQQQQVGSDTPAVSILRDSYKVQK